MYPPKHIAGIAAIAKPISPARKIDQRRRGLISNEGHNVGEYGLESNMFFHTLTLPTSSHQSIRSSGRTPLACSNCPFLWKSQKPVGGKRTLAQWMGLAIDTGDARLLARPIVKA